MNSYRTLYQKMPKMTYDQENAFRSFPQLAQFGFTAEQLQNWQGIFYSEHEKALRYLCQSGTSPSAAVTIVSNLNIAEAEGIAKGLMRDEVLGLNPAQIEALSKLQKYGLTKDLLQSWQGYEFSGYHTDALIELIENRHQTPQDAIAEINQLKNSQAEGIAKGLNREDVLHMGMYKIEALVKLKGQLTASQLRTWQGKEFYDTHTKALQFLINQRHMSAEDAIAEINQLDSSEAEGVAQGLKRDEVIGLQEQQIRALLSLRKKNPQTELTPAHLRSWQGNYFSSSHKQALVSLIGERHFKPQDAIAELNNFSEFEARMIAEKKITRDEVLGFNGWEVDILQKLKPYGLQPKHLRSRIRPDHGDDIDKSFLSGHTKALTYLIKECGMKPEDAMQQTNGLDDDQAKRIAKGEAREDILTDTRSKMRF